MLAFSFALRFQKRSWITRFFLLGLLFWFKLKHNLFKNVSKGPAILWKTQIQTIEYGLNDAIRIKKNEFILIPFSFTPFDMNFRTILIPKVILAKKLVPSQQKILLIVHDHERLGDFWKNTTVPQEITQPCMIMCY